MEERNELNDIILNRGSDSMGSSKKIALAVGVLAVILIVVVMIMKTSVSSSTDNLPQAQQAPKTNLPPEPPVPQANNDQQGNAPLFKPVEIVQENKKGDDDLDKIAQKLKQESLSKDVTPAAPTPAVATEKVVAPVKEKVVAPVKEKVAAPIVKEKVSSPVVKENVHVIRQRDVAKSEPVAKKEPVVKKEIITKKEASEQKEAPVKKESLFTKIDAPKKETSATKEPKAASKTSTTGTYYVQVGSFTKITPSDKLFGSIKKLGYAYESVKTGETSKVIVGPFKNETDAREALKALRKDVVPGAFVTKK
ncbi:MAG: SPOR domain-containing protein [Thiovulaceae bacterium]|nr:SPOR domain-containing protein [Sulfurimonadaceae bacterium]